MASNTTLSAPRVSATRWSVRLTGMVGWILVGCGVGVLLYPALTPGDLAEGPGHYPDTALPGKPGNFSVAGHRTTYGAPFFHLDQLRPGDRILVTDRDGTRYADEVSRQHVVLPSDTWVIAPDPLGTGEPTMTLTTCNPRFSAAERLVVHAESVS